MAVKKMAALALGVLVATSILFGQGPRRDLGLDLPLPDVAPPPATLPIDADMVRVDLVVTDRNGSLITGLEREHFKLFDENVEQAISQFNSIDMPLTVVVIVEFGQTFGYFYDDVVRPAAEFINSLRPNDWVALVKYDVQPEIVTDFTRNKAELFYGLQSLQNPTFRETALFDAVYDTLERLDHIDGKKAIFLLSTGFDTISRYTYGEVLKKAETSDTMIYAFSMGQAARLYLERNFTPMTQIEFLQADNQLRSLAEATGGMAFMPRNTSEYPYIYETVGLYLRNQYSLGFVPTNEVRDGKLRRLRVDVAIDLNNDGDPDNVQARHRRGYYAPRF